MPLGGLGPMAWLAALLLASLASLGLLYRLEVPLRAMHDELRRRWVWGVPWGTIIVVAWLVVVYLFVQHGWSHWYRPVVVPYTAVAIWEPTGWLLAGFSHVSPAHLRGNVTTALIFGAMVEWLWGHRTVGEGWAHVPWMRAGALFPVGIALIAVVATLFSWGPVIGFSVGAYALVGIVLVHRPLWAVVGLLARSVVRFGWETVADPVEVGRTSAHVLEPSWYGSAVQGHVVGLLLGVLVGIWLLRRTNRTPPTPGRLFAAAVLVGVSLSLWTVWWILGPELFVLYRAGGAILILAVAAVVSVAASDVEFDPPAPRRIAIGLLVVAVVGMGVVGVGLNAIAVEPAPETPQVSVADYRITYAENVPNGMVNVVDIDVLGLSTDVRTSGVIVTSEERNVWRQTVSKVALATHGIQRFTVGGIGWSQEVAAVRNGWVPIGGEPVYIVWIGVDGDYTPTYASPSQQARAVLENRTFTIRPADGEFLVEIRYQDENASVRMPRGDEVVSALGVELFREGNQVYAVIEDTGIPIAMRETYEA